MGYFPSALRIEMRWRCTSETKPSITDCIRFKRSIVVFWRSTTFPMMNATCGIEASFAPSGQRDYLDGMTQGVALGYRIIAPLGLSIPGICPRVFIIDVIAKQTRFNLRIFAQRSPRLRSGNQCSATLLQQFNRTLGFGGYLLRAGVTPWPKLWQNLRSSAATDPLRTYRRSRKGALLEGRPRRSRSDNGEAVEDPFREASPQFSPFARLTGA